MIRATADASLAPAPPVPSPSAPQRRRRWTWKGLWLWLHRWLGLTLGMYFVAMGISGSVLVYREEVDALLNPHLYAASQGERATIDAILAASGEETGDIIRILPPRDGHPTWELWVGPWQADMRQVFVDPTTAEVLGERTLAGSFAGWMQWFHYTLLLAMPGFLANGFGGLLVLGLLLTGLVLWWPKTIRQLWLRLTIKTASLKRFMLDAHNASGAWTLPLLALITFTGIVFPFHSVSESVVHAVFGEPNASTPPTLALAEGEIAPPLNAALRTGLAFGKERGLQPSRIRLPREGEAGLFLRLEPDARTDAGQRVDLTLDTRTGEIVHVIDIADVDRGTWLMYQMFPLHAGTFALGTWAGEIVRLLWFLLGLVPLLLFISGVWLWWKKRPKHKVSVTALPG